MSKRTPGSKYQMKIGRAQYLEQRARHRQRVANKSAQMVLEKSEKEEEQNG